METQTSYDQSQQLDDAAKNRAVFNDVATIAGMPSGLFLLGIVLCVGMYVVTRTILAPLILGPVYFIPMYHIHKDDLRGLKVWLSVLTESVNQWECATRKPIHLIVREKQR